MYLHMYGVCSSSLEEDTKTGQNQVQTHWSWRWLFNLSG